MVINFDPAPFRPPADLRRAQRHVLRNHGTLVLDVVAGAANRDPKLFPKPDAFDIHRQRDAHHSFSRGAHICVNQHLARVEMTRALHAVLDNLPNLRFDPARPKPEIRGSMMRVPKHLYVRFGD